MKFKSFLFALVTIAFFQCKSGNNELNILHDEVMAVHDEVMPKLSDVKKTRTKLANKISGDANAGDSIKAVWQSTADTLYMADEAMMMWMKNFKKPEDADVDAAKAYYKSEMAKIVNVSDLMNRSLASGKQLLDE